MNKVVRERFVQEGSPHPHGAIWDGRGTNFTLFSANATKVELCLFDSSGAKDTDRIALITGGNRGLGKNMALALHAEMRGGRHA